MLKPNMSNTISIGTCSSDLYIHYFFETSGTASCGTTGNGNDNYKNNMAETAMIEYVYMYMYVYEAYTHIYIYIHYT